MNAIRRSLAAALLAGAMGATAVAHDPPRTKVTWAGDIARLVHARCVRCHSPEGKGPMSLVTYEDARPWASAMREEVLARRMPKWHAARGYGQFANDPTLSPFDIALIVSWVDGGSLRGDQSKVPPPVPVPVLPPAVARQVSVACSSSSIPPGVLIGLTPELGEGASAGFAVDVPGSGVEILAWVRDYEREFAETYWLERPLTVPRGARLRADAPPRCRVTLHYGKGDSPFKVPVPLKGLSPF